MKYDKFFETEKGSDDSKVLELNGTNFKNGKLVGGLSKGLVTIMFFAPWCGHCVKLKPKFGRVAKLVCCNKDIMVGAVNADDNTDLLRSLNDNGISILGYPTIIQCENGKYTRSFTGNRDAEDLLNFMLNTDKKIKGEQIDKCENEYTKCNINSKGKCDESLNKCLRQS